MPESGRILVLTSCTSLKVAGSGPVPAERLYLGEQHRRLMRGVDYFRSSSDSHEIDLRIVSAGLGLVRGGAPIGYYDKSFSGLGRGAITEQAVSLGIPESVATVLEQPYDLALVLLGEDYIHATAIGEKSTLAGPMMAFGGSGLTSRLGTHPNAVVIPASKAEARRFHCGLIGLKGELAGRLLGLLADSPELVAGVGAWPIAKTLDLLDERQRELAVAA